MRTYIFLCMTIVAGCSQSEPALPIDLKPGDTLFYYYGETAEAVEVIEVRGKWIHCRDVKNTHPAIWVNSDALVCIAKEN